MATYVLIHGAVHGGWCWDKVVPLLKERGHNVEAPDLPGHGKDKTPISQVTLQAYANSVCRVLDALPEPVVLVGHSMGGIVISQAAECRPDKIRTLVYLTAQLVPNGASIIPPPERDRQGFEEAMARRSLVLSHDQSYVTFQDEAATEKFYGDCSEEDVARARSLLGPQSLAPLITRVQTSDENFGRIPRVYIECLLDKQILPATQKQMYTAIPCGRVLSLNTSHSPFLSAPEELVRHMVSL